MGRWIDGCFTEWKERKEECVDGSEEESQGGADKKNGKKEVIN